MKHLLTISTIAMTLAATAFLLGMAYLVWSFIA